MLVQDFKSINVMQVCMLELEVPVSTHLRVGLTVSQVAEMTRKKMYASKLTLPMSTINHTILCRLFTVMD